VEGEGTVDPLQSNKALHHIAVFCRNDVVTCHKMRVEMIKAEAEWFQNKERPFQPVVK